MACASSGILDYFVKDKEVTILMMQEQLLGTTILYSIDMLVIMILCKITKAQF